MIYRYNSFTKEVRFSFTDRKTGQRRFPFIGALAAFLTLATHFILQTMTDTILLETFPEFMMRTYFSLLFTYYVISSIVLILHYALNYRDLTFAELTNNRWYLQAKMGYNPSTLVFNKILARFVTVFFNWSFGYILTLTFGLFLKYTFIPTYTLTLYVQGLVDAINFIVIVLTMSLVKRKYDYAGQWVGGIGALYWLIKLLDGRYSVISNPFYMRNLNRYFTFFEAADDYILGFLLLTCLIFIVFGARMSTYYFRHSSGILNVVPERYKIGYVQSPEGSRRQRKRESKRVLDTIQRDERLFNIIAYEKEHERVERMAKMTNRILTFVTSAMIAVMLLFNIIVLILSAAQGSVEVSISGTIPYIFHSSTMEPAIHNNDLAYFQQIDVQEPLKVGDIVILTDAHEIFIERITEINGDYYTVDIDNYPELAKEDAMLKTVERSQIYGRFSGRNRWLGALIHFANTIMGRILFLLIPSILLFYHDKIFDWLKNWYRGGVSDEQIEAQRALHEKRLYERSLPKPPEDDPNLF